MPKSEVPAPLGEDDVPLPKDAGQKAPDPNEAPVEQKEKPDAAMDTDTVDDVFQSIDKLMQQMDDEHEPIRRRP